MGAGRQQNGGRAEQVLESATLSTERERLDSLPQKPALPENQPPGRGKNKEVGGRGERLTDTTPRQSPISQAPKVGLTSMALIKTEMMPGASRPPVLLNLLPLSCSGRFL